MNTSMTMGYGRKWHGMGAWRCMWCGVVVAMFLLVGSSLAQAAVSDDAWDVVVDRDVVVQLDSGASIAGRVVRALPDTVVMVTAVGDILDVPRADITGVRLQEAPSGDPLSADDGASYQPSAVWLKSGEERGVYEQMRESWAQEVQLHYAYKGVGRSMRVPGSILIGAGSIVTYSSLVAMLIGVLREPDCDDTGRRACRHTGVLSSTIVGTITGALMTGGGAVLVRAANKRRSAEREQARQRMQLSLSPQWSSPGVRATLQWSF